MIPSFMRRTLCQTGHICKQGRIKSLRLYGLEYGEAAQIKMFIAVFLISQKLFEKSAFFLDYDESYCRKALPAFLTTVGFAANRRLRLTDYPARPWCGRLSLGIDVVRRLQRLFIFYAHRFGYGCFGVVRIFLDEVHCLGIAAPCVARFQAFPEASCSS